MARVPRTSRKLTLVGQAGAEHAGAVNHVAFAPNGGRLYSCSSSKQVCEWNPSDGKLQRQFSGNKHGVARLAVDATSKTLLAASARIRVLSTETGKKLKRLTGHATAVDLLQFTPDSVRSRCAVPAPVPPSARLTSRCFAEMRSFWRVRSVFERVGCFHVH